jgi:hypothetical protein
MARKQQLDEMEAKNPQSRTAVNQNAKPGEPMPKLTTGIPDGQTGTWDDLGGPTPENARPDDDSAKLDDPASTVQRVADIIRGRKGSQEGDVAMPKMAVAEEEEYDEDDDYFTEESCDDDEEEKGDEDEKETPKSHRKKMSKKEEEKEDEKEMDEDFDIDDDVNALVEGEELSEEFKDKAKVIFEAALRSKVSEIKENLEYQYNAALREEVAAIAEELQERVDSYLEYVADEWMQENQLAVTRGIKEELTESFLVNLKNLFEQHYVSMPDERYDVLENMVNKLDEMENKLNEQIDKNIQLSKRLCEAVADGIFDDVADGLAVTQKEKLASLAESVEFESEESYREKLETLREAYFPAVYVSSIARPEVLTEDTTEVVPESYSASMNKYLQAASMLATN